jgi:hypothetical protein
MRTGQSDNVEHWVSVRRRKDLVIKQIAVAATIALMLIPAMASAQQLPPPDPAECHDLVIGWQRCVARIQSTDAAIRQQYQGDIYMMQRQIEDPAVECRSYPDALQMLGCPR